MTTSRRRLTPEQVAEIRARRQPGKRVPKASPDSISALADEFGVPVSMISQIVHMKAYIRENQYELSRFNARRRNQTADGSCRASPS